MEQVEIVPEPTPEEREAILAALADSGAREEDARLRAWGLPALEEEDDF